MAELKDLEAGQGAPQPAQGKKQTVLDVGLDEEADNVADFMEVRTATLQHHVEAGSMLASIWREAKCGRLHMLRNSCSRVLSIFSTTGKPH